MQANTPPSESRLAFAITITRIAASPVWSNGSGFSRLHLYVERARDRSTGNALIGGETSLDPAAPRRDYSQRNTFDDSAVQTRKTAISAATSAIWVDHGSPFAMPSRSDTA